MNKSVLFSGHSYYNTRYLSLELRKLGWKADTLNWNTTESSQKFFQGEDFKFNKKTTLNEQMNFFEYAINTYSIIHFSGANNLKLGKKLHNFFKNKYYPYYEIDLLKKLGKKIVYSYNGCLDGAKKTSFQNLKPSPCDICKWNNTEEVCSDDGNKNWGEFRNKVSDYICIWGGLRLDFNSSLNVHETPEFYCLDPNVWSDNLNIPVKYKISNKNFKVYHSVGNYYDRTQDNKNIKCTHIYEKVIKELKREGHKIDLIFTTNIPSIDVKFIQAQCDVVADMLTFGCFGANINEALMLGKPSICFIRPEWKKNILKEIPEYAHDLPIISARPDTIKNILIFLMYNRKILEKIGHKSRLFAEKWHSSKSAALKFDKIYTNLLNN